ncbi:unnamed protein product [Cuscuta epithymum]|uniref:Uncharacterized protein n=1 Tax=Cuscuta epithymum TaxID=186058 RepID=A0AAV0CYU8_9ASTE|nr:unnamed protein product [Cuscuta epithymum]
MDVQFYPKAKGRVTTRNSFQKLTLSDGAEAAAAGNDRSFRRRKRSAKFYPGLQKTRAIAYPEGGQEETESENSDSSPEDSSSQVSSSGGPMQKSCQKKKTLQDQNS